MLNEPRVSMHHPKCALRPSIGPVIRSRLAPVWTIALLVLFLASGCTGGTSPDRKTTPLILTSPRAINATTAPLLPTSRFQLPQFGPAQFHALLRQLRGTPVVVNLWGSWCGPCREEAPVLASAARRFGRRIQFVGVDLQDTRANARVYIRDAGWAYPSVFDPSRAILTGLGFLGPPITLVFDRTGRRVGLFTGPISTEKALEQVIRRTL